MNFRSAINRAYSSEEMEQSSSNNMIVGEEARRPSGIFSQNVTDGIGVLSGGSYRTYQDDIGNNDNNDEDIDAFLNDFEEQPFSDVVATKEGVI